MVPKPSPVIRWTYHWILRLPYAILLQSTLKRQKVWLSGCLFWEQFKHSTLFCRAVNVSINKIHGCTPTVLLSGLPPGQTLKSNAAGTHFLFHEDDDYAFSWGTAKSLHPSLEDEESAVLSDPSCVTASQPCERSLDEHGRLAHVTRPESTFHSIQPSHTIKNLKEITKATRRMFFCPISSQQ